MPVYASKRRGRGGARVWRLVESVDGRSHETTHTGTRREAVARCARWRVELEAAAPRARRPAQVVDLLTFSRGDYAVYAKAHLGVATWKVRRFQLANLCRHLGALRLTQIDTAAGERFQAARLGEGAGPGTINTEWSKLLAVLSYARRLDMPTGAPRVKALPVRGRGRVKFWTAEQISRLFAAVEEHSPDLLPLVVFLANTGCRKGEALACLRSWIDLAADMIRIEPNDYWQPKDGEPREIPIAPALRPFLAHALAHGVTSRYVFTSREGDRWACFPRKAFARAVRAAGLDDDGEGPHKLRHTFASHFLAGGGEMFVLSKILGHASIRTTETVYAHLLPSHLESARGVVNMGPNVGAAALEARRRWGVKK